MPVLRPLWRGVETSAVQVAVSQRMPEEGLEGTAEHFPGAVLIQVCPGIALLIARVGEAIVVVFQRTNIPLLADSAAAFVSVRHFAGLMIGAVALSAAEIFAIAVVVAVLAVAFVYVVAFVSTAAGSGLNAVLLVVAVSVAIAPIVATVVDVAVFVGDVLAVVFAAEFAVYEASVSGFAAAAAVVGAAAAAGVAAEFDSGNLFGCCLQNSHFARLCYHGIPDNSLLPSFAWAAQKLTERAEALMCSQWWMSHSAGD